MKTVNKVLKRQLKNDLSFIYACPIAFKDFSPVFANYRMDSHDTLHYIALLEFEIETNPDLRKNIPNLKLFISDKGRTTHDKIVVLSELWEEIGKEWNEKGH